VRCRLYFVKMLSRVALRAGSFSPLVTAQLQNKAVQTVAVRSSSIAKHLENWEKANNVYYGPDRDTKNFPLKKMPEKAPPTRLGFIPESFFQMFYEKTGVTGPYMFGIGVTTYLLSSELWIVEHGFTEFIAFWLAFYILAKKLGPGLGQSLGKSAEEFNTKNWYEPLEKVKTQAQAAITELEENITREEGQKLLYQAKKENVDLQLESVYRQRLAEVHQAVKRQLDYQADVEVTKRSFEQQHMVNWIVSNVQKSITPAQEKESITKCIQDLKSMAAQA